MTGYSDAERAEYARRNQFTPHHCKECHAKGCECCCGCTCECWEPECKHPCDCGQYE